MPRVSLVGAGWRGIARKAISKVGARSGKKEIMNYISLYRKWRSQTFDEVLGQEHVTRTLKNAVSLGRIAHAYLFSGPRGTGKTSTARILAKALNCESGPRPDPCQSCANCQRIREGNSLDVLEIDAASNRGIDEIRELRERVKFSPVEGPYKVYIIDEVHMLTTEAFNALLKTLEEPPEHVVFVLCTTEAHKLPPTIMSRCQRFDFRRIPAPLIKERLTQIVEAEGASIEGEALDIVVAAASGSFRDGQSILEQLLSYSSGPTTAQDARAVLGIVEDDWLVKLSESLLKADLRTILLVLDELFSLGYDPRHLTRELIQFLRQLLAVSLEAPSGSYEEREKKLEELKTLAEPKSMLFLLEPLSALESQMRLTVEPRYIMETTLLLAAVKLQAGGKGLEGKEEKANAKGAERKEEASPVANSNQRKKESVPFTPTEIEELNLEKIKGAWKAVLNEVKERKIPTYALLSKGAPSHYADGRLTITFERSFSFHKHTVEEEENRRIIKEAMRTVIGSDLELEFILKDGEEEGEEVKDHPLVKQALDLFGGSIVEIKEG